MGTRPRRRGMIQAADLLGLCIPQELLLRADQVIE